MRMHGRTTITPAQASAIVDEAMDRAHADGFAGQKCGETIVHATPDGTHAIIVVQCQLADGSVLPYVIAADLHDEPRSAPRLLPLSSVVHLVQNVHDAERWAIEHRPVQDGP